jgi:hypothetical protein
MYLKNRGGGTRGAPPRRKFGRDNNSKSGGVNGIGERMNSMTSTTTNYSATTTHPASTTSTGNSTRKTTEAAEAGTSAEGDVCQNHKQTIHQT